MATGKTYSPSDWGKKEEAEIIKYNLQRDDAKNNFLSFIRPRNDRAYKLYVASNIDRAREIQRWQANVFVPYVQAVVETLMPRILDARPEFSVQGRTPDDQLKSEKIQKLMDYTWEISRADVHSEDLVRSALVYGTGFLQVGWKKDVRTNKFLSTKDISDKKYKWIEETKTFYDAPFIEWVDNYDLWYDWRNIARENKQFWFKRKILNGATIKRNYSMLDKERLEMALNHGPADLTDYASVRYEVKSSYTSITKENANSGGGSSGVRGTIYENTQDQDLKMHEVFEWWRPFEDKYAVMVNDVPVLKNGFIPNPYNFKEAPFIDVSYLKLPNEFEGMGLPLILENPQLMMNMIKNQRLDATTLGIHKMWIVNPLANIDKNELVVRPFGIIYSNDPSGVREVEFSDIKASAYKEEELLKGDMRYASGVDDFSMGSGGGASSATEVRHLRESTLERVRLFMNHLGDAYATTMRYCISMYEQFFTKQMTIRVIGEDGQEEFPLIEKDDLTGNYDFKALAIPSIAGKNDIDKKQGMDLFQLLSPMEFIDLQKLTGKVMQPFGWTLDSITKKEEPAMPEAVPGMDPSGMPMGEQPQTGSMLTDAGDVPQSVIDQALGMLGGTPPMPPSGFDQAGVPINLLESGGMPPTAPGIPVNNKAGFNRGAGSKVNTNIPTNGTRGPAEGNMLGQAQNLQ